MKTIKLFIDEIGRNSLGEEATCFNQIKESFETKEALRTYLIERYGKIPAGKRKIYTGPNDAVKCVGILHSFWNQDISHNSKKWFQTDWITFFEEESVRTYFKL